MCGIFGFAITPKADITGKQLLRVIKTLCILSETRGKDASGLVLASPKSILVLKRPIRGSQLIRSREFREFGKKLLDISQASEPFIVMGHTRMVTNGNAEIHENNQPTIAKNMVCIHNGIVVNDESLWQEFEDLSRDFEIDTEVILALLRHYYQSLGNIQSALIETFNKIIGANSVAIIPADLQCLLLATSNGSLFTNMSDDKSIITFSSEKYILEKLGKKAGVQEKLPNRAILQLQPGSGIGLSLSEDTLTCIPIFLNQNYSKYSFIPRKVQCRQITDNKPATVAQTKTINSFSFSQLEKLCHFDISRISALKRCTKCLLPETFPFIEFDSEGVCNICHSHTPREHKDIKELFQILDPLRSTGNNPDCLVPMSGGRDSCYALHSIITKLNMTPVAYTYDWGMVTDLARRNISRMCGALGVEHILVSSDIAKKRAHIRKNVTAWLKKPHLGTVTLFMAGDKPYFYYAYMLRRQMGLQISLLGSNELESTGFKVGFCNIKQQNKGKKHFQLSNFNKMQLLYFFGKQFLSNPKYFNGSLVDTLRGFLAYYILPTDYIPLYDYIPWNEDEVNATLIGTYDWEVSPDTVTTWRIGDGTAPFYNYIYYRLAGFSENDTFRSNQIREGLLDRETAYHIAEKENKPRLESLKWYCDTIGIDCISAIKKINEIPTLY